ncbi:MAG: copper amine oxidase N-terminal domain-containing protein [Clostridia bacterium]|nr:copper amine oxidase N-terminal domain-containing protein [Clostridia bacterium]
MKKITKRIMALMLSLVMMLGCIPSFINEVSAADPVEHVITIRNAFDGVLKSDVVVEYDGATIGTSNWTNITDDNCLHANQTYSFTFMTNASVGDTCEVVIDSSSNIELTSNFESGNGTDSNTYNIPMASMIRGKIEFTVLGPKTTPIMTAETGGKDTGLTLTGTKAAVYGEDYEYATSPVEAIWIKTSGWKLEGTINSDFLTGSDLFICNGEQSTGYDIDFTIGDIDNPNGYYLELGAESTKNINVTFDITKPLNLFQFSIYSVSGTTKATINLNENYPINISELHCQGFFDSISIIGPGTINSSKMIYIEATGNKFTVNNAIINARTTIDNTPYFTPFACVIDMDIINDSKFISINDIEYDSSFGLFYMGTINVDDSSEFFASDKQVAIYAPESPAIANITPWRCSGNVVSYDNRASLTEALEEVNISDEYFAVVKDSDPVAYAKTIYKKVCEPISEIEILDNGTFDSTEFYFKTPDDANYEIDKYDTDYWYTDSDCTDVASNITEETTYYTQLKVTPKTGYKFGKPSAASVENGYISNVSSYTDTEIILTIAKTAKSNKALNLFHQEIKTKIDFKNVYSVFEEVPDSSILNVISPDGTTINGITIPGIAGGEKHFGKYGLQLRIKPSEYYSDRAEFSNITKIIINGTEYSFTKKPEDIQNEEDEYNYLFGQNVIVVENKSTVKVEEDGQQNTDNLVPSIKIFEIFDFNKNDGEIIFSGITPGCLITDVTPDGNLMSDVLGGIEVLEYSEGDWIGPTTPNFEEGKQYRIKSTLIDSDYEYKKIKINGTTFTAGIKNNAYPNESGYNYVYSSSDGSFKMFVTYDFISQTPSSGSSKKYKATDTKDTTEKITGTGKKGSTRTIVPEEGRKVASVVVTDKDGNKIDVTMNEDGTYSFEQPASNVDVLVSYKNREITLNIGSTEASVDGEKSNLDVCPVIRNDRTMLPIRFVAENLGAKVEWSEKNPNYVVITRGDTKIEITLGSGIMKVNGKDVKLDSVAFAENDRTYLPVRAISEALNAIVEWNENEPSVVRIYEQQ